jgi:hypothetical protein
MEQLTAYRSHRHQAILATSFGKAFDVRDRWPRRPDAARRLAAPAGGREASDKAISVYTLVVAAGLRATAQRAADFPPPRSAVGLFTGARCQDGDCRDGIRSRRLEPKPNRSDFCAGCDAGFRCELVTAGRSCVRRCSVCRSDSSSNVQVSRHKPGAACIHWCTKQSGDCRCLDSCPRQARIKARLAICRFCSCRKRNLPPELSGLGKASTGVKRNARYEETLIVQPNRAVARCTHAARLGFLRKIAGSLHSCRLARSRAK